MARTLKGTRARGLPPKLLLSQRQDATGSFPTVWRTASDNRTGKYPVFFNDNKVVSFNQPVTDVGFYVTTYPHYQEIVVTVGSPGNPETEQLVTFSPAFPGTPTVVITEITSNPNTATVNAFTKTLSTSNVTVVFSAPFEGTLVCRAIYQSLASSSTVGPVNVVRSPRYTDQYSLVINRDANLPNNNNAFVEFSDFGSVPEENYVTFFDYLGNGQADISASIPTTFITNTSVQVTGSATAAVELRYLGVGRSTASIDVRGIIYPLAMTQEAINAGLSTEAAVDLYKKPYSSGSEIVNQPIVTSGSMTKGVSDLFVTFTPGQDVEPFMDFANPEVDGKVSASVGGVNPFYATGSAITTTGLGFQQPLWSKNKIEIDITPATTQTMTFLQTGSVGSYPMGYWNPNTKLYEGIGTGKGRSSYSNTANGLRQFLEEQTFGFGASMDNGGTLTNLAPYHFNIKGRQISNLGFPYHIKFQPTSSQLISMSDFISEPFLLEKVILEYSGSIYSNAPGNTAIWTFFLLMTKNYINSSTSPTQTIYYDTNSTPPILTITTSSLTSQTVCDIIDHMQMCVSSSFDTQGFLDRELLLPSATVSKQFILESTVKNSIAYERGLAASFSGSSVVLGGGMFIQSLDISGRNQLGNPSGRDWTSNLVNPVTIGTASYQISSTVVVPINSQYTKPNPYILLPSDRITFGYQLPWWEFAGGGFDYTGHSNITFSPTGINKIILYGSTLRLNPETNQLEEHHDTLNQLLSSNSIHETIG